MEKGEPMARYIDADKLIKTIRDNDYLVVDYFNSKDRGMFTTGIMQAIDEQPTVDVRENVRGEWIEPKPDGCWHFDAKAYAECSVCGKKQFLGYQMHFCPNCGADMRERGTDG